MLFGDQPPDFRDPRMWVDFTDFHPLDHSVITCRGYPGGRRRHAQIRWMFEWRDRLYARTFCRVGRHEIVRMWRRLSSEDEMQVFRACRACLSPPPDFW